jgi:hypothetical protein
VGVVNLPTYVDEAGFVTNDPTDAGQVKKDETVTVRVTSDAGDVDGGTVRVRVWAAGQEWDAGQGVACNVLGWAFCQDYTLALGPQRMDAFTAPVDVEVTGRDVVGNEGRADAGGLFTVTRWKWARRIISTTEVLKASPAIGAGGFVWVASAGGVTAGGLFRVSPDGEVTQVANDGPIEASPAIGRDGMGNDFVFYMTTNGPIRILGDTANCGRGDSSNVASLAILNDGDAGMRGVGLVGPDNSRYIRALDPASGCDGANADGGLPASIYPGNVVVTGDTVLYPTVEGTVERFTRAGASFNQGSPTPIASSGVINGLSLFGTNVAGGGGVGVGRVFVTSARMVGGVDGDITSPRHVSGLAVGQGDVLFAVTQEATGGPGLLKKFSATGMAMSAVVWPIGFTFNFSGTMTPGGTTPVLGDDGWVYVVANNGNVAGVRQSDLSVRWTRAMAGLSDVGQVLASATLDCNRTKPGSGTGIYYFATTGGWLVAYIVDSPGGLDSTAPWPKYQHDARNTGNLSASKACP